MADLQFPFEAYLQAKQQQQQNKLAPYQLIGQAISQAGQTGAQILQARAQQMKQQREKDQLNQWLQSQAKAFGPQQQTANVLGKPNVPTASFDPNSGQVAPNMTPGNPQMQNLFSGLANAPFKVQEQALPKIFEQDAKGIFGGVASKPQGAYYINPSDPSQVSLTPKDGWQKIVTSQADAGSKVTSAAQGQARTKAMQDRVAAWNRSTDTKQIDALVKSTGLTPKNISAIQQNSFRGQRAMQILSKPGVTWQELNASRIDFAGMMQGGAPQVGEIQDTRFPNINENLAQWNTYITGDVPENVPEPIRQAMLDMTSSVVSLDNNFLDASNKFQKKMIGPTIQGGLGKTRSDAIDAMQKAMTGGAMAKPSAQGKATLRWDPATNSLVPVQ